MAAHGELVRMIHVSALAPADAQWSLREPHRQRALAAA